MRCSLPCGASRTRSGRRSPRLEKGSGAKRRRFLFHWGWRVGTSVIGPRNRDFRSRASESVALLVPVVGVVVVAVALPEAGLVDRRELDAAKPLRALPEVLRGDEEARGPAVLGGQRRAVGLVDDQGVLVLDRGERDVRGEALLGVRDREAGARLGPGELRELAPADALELRVEPAPAGDAVDVGRDLGRGQRGQLLVAEAERLLDLAGHLQRPGREVDVRDVAGVEHGPLVREVLAGREAGWVEAGRADLVLRLAPEHGHRFLH